MSDSFSADSILVCGAGTMGAGIAQAAIESGIRTFLFDTDAGALQRADQQIRKFLGRAVEKGRLNRESMENALALLCLCPDYKRATAGIIIEAIAENEEAKIRLFQDLALPFPERTIFVTNTSSLSVSRIAAAVPCKSRVAGMHFFNPAPLMKLVEIVSTSHTDEKVTTAVTGLARQMGKVPVMVHDAPGFIVNRIARHFYLEAFRMTEDSIACRHAVDKLMEGAGFKMGPFALTDLIGQDVNFAVTRSLYAAFHQEPRFRPSRVQAAMVEAGFLGRKTGRGFYDYKK